MERRKRIALSVPPEMDEVLERLAVLTNQPKNQIDFGNVGRIRPCT